MGLPRARTIVVSLLGALLLAVAPAVVDQYWRYILTMWMVMSLAAIGLNIPLGLGQIFSFGHGAFVLVGAYVTGVAMTQWSWSFVPSFFLSLPVAAVIGAILARPSLRLSGFSLAIVTFSFAYMLFHLVKALDYTGGPQGIFMPSDPVATLLGGKLLYYIILVVSAGGLAGFISLSRSKSGRAMRLSGENPIVAQSLGIRVLHYRTAAFVLSAVYGAAAGSLMAMLTSYVAPETFSPELSVNLFAAVAIGGIGTIIGPLLGALFIVIIPEVTQSIQNLSQIIYALLFCLVVTVFPAGLVGLFSIRRKKRLEMPARAGAEG